MPLHWDPQPYYPPLPPPPPPETESDSEPDWISAGGITHYAQDAESKKFLRSQTPLLSKAVPIKDPGRRKTLPSKYGRAFSVSGKGQSLEYVQPKQPPKFDRPPTPENKLCAVETTMPWAFWAGRFAVLLDLAANSIGMVEGGWTNDAVADAMEKANLRLRSECMTAEALESYEAFWRIMKQTKET
jgi:hypothetical protein